MKKLYSLLAFLFFSQMYAVDFTVNNIKYTGSDSAPYTATVTGFTSSFSGAADLSTVTYNGNPYTVTFIADRAFDGCLNLTSVNLGNSVTSIGKYAFSSISLTSVTIPNSVINIGSSAFAFSGLTSVTIPNSVTSIGANTFVLCRNLTSVNLGNSVTSIGNSAFAYCDNLTSVIIPNSVTSIGTFAFNQTGLASVTIPNSVISIEDSAFLNCKNLTSVIIPDSVTSIGDNAFGGSGLTSVIIPNSVTSINFKTFAECTSLTSVTIPNSVTSIGSAAFLNCKNLTSVIIPDSVTSIVDNAFGGSGLTSVTIPNSVTSIGDYAFFACEALTSFTVKWASPVPINRNVFQFTPLYSVTLKVPVGTKALYQAAPTWLDFGSIEDNEPPTGISLSVNSINENVVANSVVATLTTTDADVSDRFIYTLVSGTGDTDNASFSISGIYLVNNASPDFETKSSYTVRVRTTDQGGLSFEKDFAITVNDRNEPPTGIVLSATTIDENISADSPVGTLSSTDQDASNTFTYSLVSGTGDTDNTSFNISGNSLRITASPDFETKSSYTVRVRTTDQGDLSFEKDFTITVNDLSYASLLTFENINKTYTDINFLLGATSNSTGTISYSVVGGTGQVILSGITNRAVGLKTVGTVIIRATQVAAGDYTSATKDITLTITAKPITVTADASQTKVYGTSDPSLTYSVSQILFGTDTFTGALSRVEGENVGTYSIEQGDLSAGSNYTIAYVAKDFAINAKPITVTSDASQTKVYGTTDPSLTYSVSPSLVGTDTFTGALSRAVGENVGTYAIAQGTLNAGANYAVTFVPANYSITKADQVITWNQTLVSDCGSSASIVLTATSNSGLPISYTSSNSNVATVSNGVLNFGNYGSATITANQQGNSNYNVAQNITLPIVSSQSNLIKQQFDDVIFFDNSSASFKSYTWYKNGILVAGQTAQYFKENGPLNGTYYAVATKTDGSVIITCPLTLSPVVQQESMKIVPNPVVSNGSYQLITNIDAAKVKNARILVYNVIGTLLSDLIVNEQIIQMEAPATAGVYIIKLILSNGKVFTKNLLVRN